MARAKAMAKPVSSAGAMVGKITSEGLPARGAQACGGFFQFLFGVFQHRLHGAHHKGQADEDQRDHHARWVERQLDAQGSSSTAHPAVARQQRGQRNAGHGRGQRKRQVHQRIHDLLARKAVAHQHPGDQQAKERIDKRRNKRRAKGQPVRAASTRGLLTADQNCSQVSVKVLNTSADSGISTIMLR
jgi:hypothetical protein